MNIKKIIREEIDDMDWLRNIDPYSFVKNYYDSFSTKRKISRMSNDYAHLKSDKNNLKEILYTMGYEGVIDEPLMLKALTKYYKENIPLIKRFWSRFNYDDLQYVHNQIIDTLFENTDDLEWIIREEVDDFNWIPKETKIKTDLDFEKEINTEEAKENFKNEVNGYYAISTPKGKDSPENVLAYGSVPYLKQVLSYLNKTGIGNESDLYLTKIKYSKKDMDNVLSFIKYY
jgi:hypothetical protein